MSWNINTSSVYWEFIAKTSILYNNNLLFSILRVNSQCLENMSWLIAFLPDCL